MNESAGVLAEAIRTQRLVYILDSKDRKTALAFFMERKLAEGVIDKASSCACLYADYCDMTLGTAWREALASKVHKIFRDADIDFTEKNLSDLREGLIKGLRKILREKPIVWKYYYKKEFIAWKFDPWIPVHLAQCYHDFSHDVLKFILEQPFPYWKAASKYFEPRIHEEKWDIFALAEYHRKWAENFLDAIQLAKESSASPSGGDEGAVKSRSQKAKEKASRRLSRKEEAEILKLYKEGKPIREIAACKEVSEQTVRNVLDRLGVSRKKQKHSFERYKDAWGEHN